MNLDNIATILYLTAIPVFIIGFISLIVQFIRKKNKKVPIIMIFVSILLVVGCLGVPLLDDQEEIASYVSSLSEEKAMENIDEEIEKKVKADVSVYCMFNYDNVKNTLVYVTTTEQDGNIFYVYGKVDVIDNYGDKYEGKFNAKYRFENGQLEKIDLSVETPRKK